MTYSSTEIAPTQDPFIAELERAVAEHPAVDWEAFFGAYEMLDLGYTIVPVHPTEKRPWRSYDDQTRDPSRLLGFAIAGVNRWGIVPQPGQVMLDVDRPDLPVWLVGHPATLTVCRGERRHIYFSGTGPNGARIDDVDVRTFCQNGTAHSLLVAPGTMHYKEGLPTERYRLVSGNTPVAALPEGLLPQAIRTSAAVELAREALEAEGQTIVAELGVTDYTAERERLQRIAQSAKPAIAGQGGDDQTYATALRLADFLPVYTDVLAALNEYNTRCQPPWSKDRIERNARRAVSYALRDGAPNWVSIWRQSKQGVAFPTTATEQKASTPPPTLFHDPETDSVIAMLSEQGIYQRCGALVRVVAGSPPRKVRNADGTDRLLDLEEPNIEEMLKVFGRYGKRSDRAELARFVLARRHWPGVPEIFGLTALPVIRPDGSVTASRGYDRETGYFITGRAWEGLGEGDPHEAMAALEEVFCDFPAVRPEQRSALVGLILTVLSKPSYDEPTPLTLIEAASCSSGKTLACDIISLICTGRRVPKREAPKTREEWPKALMALLECSYPFAQIDNIVGELRTDTLDVVGTATVYAGRRLGANDARANREIPVATVLALTGNNARVSRDLGERLVRVRIVRDHETPPGGWRHPHLLSWVENERERLLRAAYAVLCGYRRLPAERRAEYERGLRPMKVGIYDAWSSWVRGPLMWLRGHDVAPTAEEKAELAEGDAGIDRLIPELARVAGEGKEFTLSELPAIELDALAKEYLPPPKSGFVDAAYVGVYLRRLRDRVVDGLKLTSRLAHGKARYLIGRVGLAAEPGGVGWSPNGSVHENRSSNIRTWAHAPT